MLLQQKKARHRYVIIGFTQGYSGFSDHRATKSVP